MGPLGDAYAADIGNVGALPEVVGGDQTVVLRSDFRASPSFAILLCSSWRELAEDGYSNMEVRVTPIRTEIFICAPHTQNELRELKMLWFFQNSSSISDFLLNFCVHCLDCGG